MTDWERPEQQITVCVLAWVVACLFAWREVCFASEGDSGCW